MRCTKVHHDGDGYLHHSDDDSPYRVDGVDYCGRCHAVLPHDIPRRDPTFERACDYAYRRDESIRADERAKVLSELRPLVRALARRDWAGWDAAMEQLRREVGL